MKKKTRIALLATEFHPQIADEMIAEVEMLREKKEAELREI